MDRAFILIMSEQIAHSTEYTYQLCSSEKEAIVRVSTLSTGSSLEGFKEVHKIIQMDHEGNTKEFEIVFKGRLRLEEKRMK